MTAKHLTKDMLTQLSKPSIKTYRLDELDVDVSFIDLPEFEMEKYQSLLTKRMDKDGMVKDLTGLQRELVARTLCDTDGNLVCETADELSKVPFTVFRKLYSFAAQTNGLMQGEQGNV